MTNWERERLLRLEKEVEELKTKIRPVDLHTQAKLRMVKTVKKHKKFSSKRQWGLFARVSMDTFYRIIEEVESELCKQGFRIVYVPVYSRKNPNRVYRYQVRLERA